MDARTHPQGGAIGGRQRGSKVSERTALAILQDIAERGLVEGDRLPQENEMLSGLGVSRQSLKEALRLLEVQGMVTLRPGPGGGVIVGAATPKHLSRTLTLHMHHGRTTYASLIDAVVEMETLCATRAAHNPDRALRQRLLTPFLDLSYLRAAREWPSGVPQLHHVIYQLVDNDVLALLTASINVAMEDHITSMMDTSDIAARMFEEHADIAAAIIAGHASKSAKLTRAHFQDIADHYRQHWPDRLLERVEWR